MLWPASTLFITHDTNNFRFSETEGHSNFNPYFSSPNTGTFSLHLQLYNYLQYSRELCRKWPFNLVTSVKKHCSLYCAKGYSLPNKRFLPLFGCAMFLLNIAPRYDHELGLSAFILTFLCVNSFSSNYRSQLRMDKGAESLLLVIINFYHNIRISGFLHISIRIPFLSKFWESIDSFEWGNGWYNFVSPQLRSLIRKRKCILIFPN